MIIVGDVHAEFDLFNTMILSSIPPNVPVIQVGDLGAWPQFTPKFVRPFDWIGGNHEYQPGLTEGAAPCPIPAMETDVWVEDPNTGLVVRKTKVIDTTTQPMLVDGLWHGARYRRRGEIDVIDGRRVAFLGGAESIVDRVTRKQYVDWWPEEAIRHEDVIKLLDYTGPPIDLLITHMPPNSMVRSVWGYSSTYSQKAVEAVWEYLGRPRLVCGHCHPSKPVHWNNVTCLPIMGVLSV